jgi:hypothetical protein
MERYPDRFFVLLIDFDRDADRLRHATTRIPEHLRDRVFILGAWSEPEELKRADLGSYEEIGLAMARDCRENTTATWDHDLLRNNIPNLRDYASQFTPSCFKGTQRLSWNCPFKGR